MKVYRSQTDFFFLNCFFKHAAPDKTTYLVWIQVQQAQNVRLKLVHHKQLNGGSGLEEPEALERCCDTSIASF